ncbi:LpqM protein [Mycobacteroides abscessus M94]|nr:LpqM protein [Mycobacteroides abscessus M94]
MSITAVESGLRPDAPRPTVTVAGTDHGRIDRLAALAVEDTESYWSSTVLPGNAAYSPVTSVTSWDSRSGAIEFCDTEVTGPNAAFCIPDRSVGWDRGRMLPVLVEGMGDLGAVLVIAHELGHAVDAQTQRERPTVLVGEQRADCYAGSYMAWVAEGESPRFQVSPEGLDLLMEALPVVSDAPEQDGDHGNAVERLWAFQQGFMRGADACAAIDGDTVTAHRDGVQAAGGGDNNISFTQPLVDAIALATEQVTGVQPDTSTVDIDALNDMSRDPAPGVRGDGTGAAALIALLVQPWVSEQHVHSPRATSCAVGAVARGMASGSSDVTLSAGDLDEMVLEVLTVGRGATDASGVMPSSGFERVRGFLAGVYSGLEVCAG